MEPTGIAPTTVALLAVIVSLISVVVTVLVMKRNSDDRYMTKEQCGSERQLLCTKLATIEREMRDERKAYQESLEKSGKATREELASLKRTLRIALNMCRALVAHSDIEDETKASILNNDGGSQ